MLKMRFNVDSTKYTTTQFNCPDYEATLVISYRYPTPKPMPKQAFTNACRRSEADPSI